MVYYITILSGGFYEACLWPDAFLFRNWYDSAFVYPGDAFHTGVYHRMSGSGISSVLLLTKFREQGCFGNHISLARSAHP